MKDVPSARRAKELKQRHTDPLEDPFGAPYVEETPRFPESTERWRPLVEKYFLEADVAWAMRVMHCESRGNPDAINSSSGASGLFQHMPEYWEDRAIGAGFPDAGPLDPEANIAASAWLYYHPAPWGGPRNWVCK